MIISGVNLNYQKSNQAIFNKVKLVYNMAKFAVLSFLTSKLSQHKLMAIMFGLLLFQFGLYDFDFSEYVSYR
jgi:hypothetical protein